ncbi:MAG: NADH-quinone oxidoreductase subunit NuoE [Pseudomonadota bacterium]|nr:NADH-quinone oxidoreductase subunit NuoE [Pseudomonadota bacterium]
MSVRRLDPVQPAAFSFAPDNLSRAKQAIACFPKGKQASAVIQLLWFAQEQDGWVSRPAIEYVGRMLEMAYIRVLEVATFYTMFHLSPVGSKAHIQVCGTTPCMLRGSEDLIAVCQSRIHPEPHHLNADGSMSWEEVECLGSCVNAPMIQIVKDTYEDLTPESLSKIIDDFQAGRPVKPGPQNGRQFSMALTGATSLTDKSLYNKQRSYNRVEAPPPAPPAASTNTLQAAPPPAATGQSPPASPGSVKPAPQDIRPISMASKQVDAQKKSEVSKEVSSTVSGNVTTEKAQAETGIVRTTADKVTKATTPVSPPADNKAMPVRSASKVPAAAPKVAPAAPVNASVVARVAKIAVAPAKKAATKKPVAKKPIPAKKKK